MQSNDLISRSALRKRFSELCPGDCSSCDYNSATNGKLFCGLIDNAPAVDAEPVRHGEWTPKKVGAITTEFECSECGRTVTLTNDFFGKATNYASSHYPYCHCGAKMDTEVET